MSKQVNVYRVRAGSFTRLYYTEHHAEQLARALRLHGMEPAHRRGAPTKRPLDTAHGAIMRTYRSTTCELNCLRSLARYETHGGYSWAAVMSDGELMCVPCVRGNYRQVFKATRDKLRNGWALQGAANSGETDEMEFCANCDTIIWEPK